MALARMTANKGRESNGSTRNSGMAVRITQKQKQALIDNLQLELTERARKLRAQYALQAQSLQARIELRVNRIPTSLRKVTLGELLQKHEEEATKSQVAKTAPKASSKSANANTASLRAAASPALLPRGLKRTSDVLDSEDKENTPDPSYDVAVPKKRAKVGGPNASAVLSPKSSNSRTLPQSPARHGLGAISKATIAGSRPASPLKGAASAKVTHASPFKAAAAAATHTLASMVGDKVRGTRAGPSTAGSRKAAATSTTSTRAKKATAALAERTVSASSNASGSSTSTTIVRKVGRALNGASAAAKKTGTAGAAAKRAATAKAKVETATAAKRTLRKRV